jgi:polysaccharide lyase-like protein
MFLTAVPAWAGVVWRGDFETGDRSQYSAAQMVSADRLQVVTSPVAEGRYALKATVKQGDNPIGASGNRNELVYMTQEAEGSEYYYRWKVMFAADYPSARAWQLFTQWHHDGSNGSPPVEFYVYGEEIRLRVDDSVDVWSAPLVRSVWHEFVFHVKWSPDPNVGFVELWHNRERVVPRRNVPTMFPGMRNYLKLGLYRSDTIAPVGVVYHDGFTQATQLEDVLPPPTSPTPDAGTPDAGTPDAGTSPSSDPGSQGTGGEPVLVPEDNATADGPNPFGCSVAGSPLLAIGLLSLMGGLLLRRRQ